MQKYLREVTEWAAQRILARAVARVSEILGTLDAAYDASPKALPAPKLPAVELGE